MSSLKCNSIVACDQHVLLYYSILFTRFYLQPCAFIYNLTVDNYIISQMILLKWLKNKWQIGVLKEQVAAWFEFNEYRGVSTPFEVYWILADGKQEFVQSGKLEYTMLSTDPS